MKIAIDFDGTIVQHKYPEIGEDLLFAFETMKQMQKLGHQLILWTFRHGKYLDEAVEYCRKKGVDFYAVNQSFPEEIFDANECSRKIHADLFIDDRIVGGFPGWSEIWQLIHPEINLSEEDKSSRDTIKNNNSVCKRFKRLFNS